MSTVGPIKWISAAQVRSALTWDRLVPAMTETLKSVSVPGDVEQPLRARLHDSDTGGTVLAMPGLVRPARALATKLLSMYPSNAAQGLPTHSALLLLCDHINGLPLALLDGCSITELRTAAASAAATLAIRAAKGDTDVPVVAILGTGTQGVAHARVMHHCLRPSQIRLWSRSGCEELVNTLVSEGVPAVSCTSVQEAVKGAGIINTCTLATTPILSKQWVMEGAHINGVGAARSDQQELDPELVRCSAVYADSKEAALAEAGDVILSGAVLEGEIGEVIAGNLAPPKGKVTIFKSLGMAAEDAVAARLVYDDIYSNN